MELLENGVEANELRDSSLRMESNEIEQNKVGIMRAIVEAEDPSAKVPHPFLFRSFFAFLYHRIVCRLNCYYCSCFQAK